MSPERQLVGWALVGITMVFLIVMAANWFNPGGRQEAPPNLGTLQFEIAPVTSTP